MAHPRRFARGVSQQRRKSSWSFGPEGATTQFTASGSSMFTFGSQILTPGTTLVRTRGQLSVKVALNPTLADHMLYSFGICIISENANAVGITAVPTPFADINWDGWLYHSQGLVGTGSGQASLPVPFEIDSKAMRKAKQTDVVVGVVEVTETGAVTADFFLRIRLLFKLP